MKKLPTPASVSRTREERVQLAHLLLRRSTGLLLGLLALATFPCASILGNDHTVSPTIEPAADLQLPSTTSSVPVLTNHQVAVLSGHQVAVLSGHQVAVLSGHQVAVLAAENCNPAKLLLQNHASEDPTSQCHDEAVRATLWEVRCAASQRLREEAARNALKLHHALAATYRAEELLGRTQTELKHQQTIQAKLLDQGISIPDVGLIDRLSRDWEDRVLENRSKQSQLRIQLSGLIGSEWACHYLPQFDPELAPSDQDICHYHQLAMTCRQEILLLKRLRRSVDEEHLEIWDSVAGSLLGTPIAFPSGSTWMKKIRRTVLREEVEQAIRNRSRWLETLIQERSKQLVIEVEVAYEAKRAAALRWANAKRLTQSWDRRLEELVQLGEEVAGNLASQSEARLERLASERGEIERWLDWHTAQTDLQFASGIILSP